MGVTIEGNREILGLSIGDSEDKVFWTEFLQSLRARGLVGVELVISDAHLGLKAAIQEVLVGSAWQRCRVHFMRNVLVRVPKAHGQMVSALIRTIFAQPDRASVEAQLDQVAGQLESRFDVVADMRQRRQGGPLRLRLVPSEPLDEDLVEQPLGAGQR